MSTDASFQALRVAVVGHGSIGKRHCDNLAALGVTQRVVVRRAQGANSAFIPSADIEVVHSLADALQRRLNLVIVCNPTSMHAAIAVEALNAGVPVLVEKPLAESLHAAQGIQQAAEREQVLAAVAYPLRYHAAYQHAQRLIANGELGLIQSAKAWFHSYLPDWHPWEDYQISYAARPELGGGVLPTLDHEIDFLHWCLGSPRQARGTSTRTGRLAGNFHDTAELQVSYDHAVQAEISLSLSAANRARGFQFIGSSGSLSFDWQQQHLLQTDSGGRQQTIWRQPDYPVNQMYLELLRDMLHAVATGAAAPTPLRCGLATLWVMQQVRHAA